MSNYSVCLRDFEERDIDFVFKCKNDDVLNEMIVGISRKFTYEDAKKWVEGCIGNHETYKFWAVATNDDERRIVGWVSISAIDAINSNVCQHGLVMGDNDYRDGYAMFEAMLLSMNYVFQKLKMHRLYGDCISEHKITPHLMTALGYTLEGKRSDAIYKNGRYYDILEYGILSERFYEIQSNGGYEINSLVRRFIKSLKK